MTAEEPLVRVRRIIGGPPERVFDAWLDPEAIRVWMCPGDIFESVATIEPRVGGRFTIVMRSPGTDDVHAGEYLEIDRPRRLVFTWRSASTHESDTVVTIEIRESGPNESELVLEHRQLPPDQIETHAIGWRAHLRLLIDWIEAAQDAATG